MRKLILGALLLLSMFSLVSCGNESKMKSGIKSYLEKNAKDPGSYQLVELKIIDTITVSSIAKNSIKVSQETIDDNNKELLQWQKTKNSALESCKKWGHDFDHFVTEANTEIETLNGLNKIASDDISKYKNKVNDKTILGYRASHKFRLKNGFGALDLDEQYVVYDKDFNFLDMTKTESYIPKEIWDKIEK